MTSTGSWARWSATVVTPCVALGLVMSLAGDADAKRRKKRKAKPPKPLKMLKTPFLDATEARVWHELRLVRQSPRHYAASKMKAFKGRYEGANIKVGRVVSG